MTVKRYEAESDPQDGPCSIWMEERPEGQYVTYSDYQKLVAENAALKESRRNLSEFIHEELDVDYPLNMDIETPDTDAAIAEIKARGVDALALHMEFNGYSNEASGARKFAANLRAGRKG